jgi:hypothetical protein
MCNKFLEWHRNYDTQVRWFFIGVFTVLLIRDVSAGNALGAFIDIVIICLNLWPMNDRRGS